jgi:hypothetical protein
VSGFQKKGLVWSASFHDFCVKLTLNASWRFGQNNIAAGLAMLYGLA